MDLSSSFRGSDCLLMRNVQGTVWLNATFLSSGTREAEELSLCAAKGTYVIEVLHLRTAGRISEALRTIVMAEQGKAGGGRLLHSTCSTTRYPKETPKDDVKAACTNDTNV